LSGLRQSAWLYGESLRNQQRWIDVQGYPAVREPKAAEKVVGL
jgi:hypothetical protein